MIDERQKEIFVARFRKGAESECWPWKGTLTAKGYGVLQSRRKNIRAHRLAYELANGPIPDGLVLDHLCRNPACVNPSHLEAVSSRQNTLRGISPSAVNARLQACRRGHLLTPDNVPANAKSKGWRACRRCHNEANAQRRARIALTAAALRARAATLGDGK